MGKQHKLKCFKFKELLSWGIWASLALHDHINKELRPKTLTVLAHDEGRLHVSNHKVEDDEQTVHHQNEAHQFQKRFHGTLFPFYHHEGA